MQEKNTLRNEIVTTDNNCVQEHSEHLLVGADRAASMLGIGRSLLYELNSSGKLGPLPMKLGRRTLFCVKELREWIDAGMPPRQKWIDRRKN